MTQIERSGLRSRGAWPDRVILSQGWGKAHARPWNDDTPAATVRLERGSARFLAVCTEWLAGRAQPIISPALPPERTGLWTASGYLPSAHLLLFEHDLIEVVKPSSEIMNGVGSGLAALADVDHSAFPPPWRTSALGLAESLQATTRSAVHRIEVDGNLIGFALSGMALGIGYLQRLAVRPEFQGQGIGSDLIAASLRWARQVGAGSVLVNTQPDNPAADLYRNRGFRPVRGGLEVLSAFGSLF